VSSNEDELHRQDLSHNELHDDGTNEKGQSSSHVSHANLSQYGHLDNLTFGNSSNNGSGTNTTAERINSHSGLSALDQGALLRGSTDWTSFSSNHSMAEDLYSHSTGPSSHQNSPYYTLSESQQRDHETSTTNFIDNFGSMNHREDLFAGHHFNTTSKQDNEERGSGIGLGAAFSTPATSTKALEHSRTFSNENLGLSQKRMTSSQPSASMNLDMDGLETNPLRMNMSPSPTNRNFSGHDNVRNFHRHARSMGQVGAEMSNSHDGLLRLNGPPLTPIDASSLDRFGVRNRITSQSSSLRSTSPSDRSVSSTAFLGGLSPHTSISTMRHGGDSSVDTSIDSISNSVTSMSANPSRSSSTSDELMSIGTSASSKKSNKGKTRLRNIDRKLICEAARDDPKIRQEDLAARFGIERSTVSKTLKNKEKWLAIEEESEGALIIKHRNGKFPKLEALLAEWAREEVRKGNLILDVSIKHRALQIAKESGLGVDSFKASIGWIEKFRDRHELPKPLPSNSESGGGMAGSSKASGISLQQKANRKTFERGLELPLTGEDDSLEEHLGSPEEVDMASLFSPRQTMLRSAPSSSSISNDETASLTTHETPKASKRHYDDMDSQKIGSSIDSGMARMHFLQRPADDNHLLTLEDSPEIHSTVEETVFAPMPSSASKRRKDGNGVSASPHSHQLEQEDYRSMAEQQQQQQQQHQQVKNRNTLEDVRANWRRSHSGIEGREQTFGNVMAPQQQEQRQDQGHQVTAAVAAANELRRMEGANAALQRNTLEQQQQMGSANNASTTRDSVRLQRTTSSPMVDCTPFYRTFSQGSNPEMASQEGQTGVVSSSALPTPSLMASIGFNEDRQVTLEEARESLELVLAFIARQPANLSPSDYFVLGNLQGTLSALAGQGQQQHPPPQQQQQHHHHQQQQQQHQQQQHQQQAGGQMNLLGMYQEPRRSH